MSTRTRQASAALAALAVAVSVLAGGCFSERSTGPRRTGASASCRIPVDSSLVGRSVTIVAVQAFSFQPDTIRVSPGTTVVWVNCEDEGVAPHTTTADGGTWDSSFLEPGEFYSRTFDDAGEYDYHCEPHPFMQGVVVVE